MCFDTLRTLKTGLNTVTAQRLCKGVMTRRLGGGGMEASKKRMIQLSTLWRSFSLQFKDFVWMCWNVVVYFISYPHTVCIYRLSILPRSWLASGQCSCSCCTTPAAVGPAPFLISPTKLFLYIPSLPFFPTKTFPRPLSIRLIIDSYSY